LYPIRKTREVLPPQSHSAHTLYLITVTYDGRHEWPVSLYSSADGGRTILILPRDEVVHMSEGLQPLLCRLVRFTLVQK
jgi:hypothetical protein